MSLFRSLLSVFILLSFYCQAQETSQLNASEIKLGLQKLNVVGNVLYIAAHPDDENTRLLAYLAKERKFRTGYLSVTRGDGGQNLIGPEQAELLGVIRTQELLAARRIDGAEQYFTRANDFGFSKTSEESLRLWGKEQILADMVWVIRNFKPDVIITRFPEDARAGHGQHAASAILAKEAFFAAADAKRFPEQLKSVKTWQAKRLLWNTFNFNAANNTTSDEQLKINVGLYNPLLGKSYGEISAESRTNHKSQGFGSANQRGDMFEYFSHVAGDESKTDLFDGINTSWNRVAGAAALPALISKADKDFDSTDPSKSVEALLEIKKQIDKVGIPSKTEEVNQLILACAGIWLELNSTEQQYAIGDSIPVRLQAIARVPASFKYQISVSDNLSKQSTTLLPNKFSSVNGKIKFSTDTPSQPYWLQDDNSIGAYVVKNQSDVGLPENKAAISTTFSVNIGGSIITTVRPVVYKFTDQVRGEITQPVSVAPPVTASLGEKAFIFKGNEPKIISVQLQSFRDKSAGKVQLSVPKGWKVSPASIDFNLQKGSVLTKEFIVTPSAGTGGEISASISIAGKTYNQGIKEINYHHIPAQTLFPVAKAKAESLDLKTTGKKIAYIAGAGDLVAESIKQLDFDVTMLTTSQVLTTSLAGFDAVITGVRLYNVNEDVKLIQPKLLEYASNGGVVLVQYNVNNPLYLQSIGPYPFSINRDRVTEEDAAVAFINPGHRVLNHPNKITSKDFDGWIQERGLYFTSNIDPKYDTIISLHDKDEKPNAGSLLVAEVGKGRFVYTSLSFFRQLPAGVPGAYRLFVNLISK